MFGTIRKRGAEAGTVAEKGKTESTVELRFSQMYVAGRYGRSMPVSLILLRRVL
jgi:hypothetical protein